MLTVIRFVEQGHSTNPIETPMLKSQMSTGKRSGQLWQWEVITNWEEQAGYPLHYPHNYMARKHTANCRAGDSAATGVLDGPHSTYTLRCMLTALEPQRPASAQAGEALLRSPAEGFPWSLEI